jgi:hypothetical protein
MPSLVKFAIGSTLDWPTQLNLVPTFPFGDHFCVSDRVLTQSNSRYDATSPSLPGFKSTPRAGGLFSLANQRNLPSTGTVANILQRHIESGPSAILRLPDPLAAPR